MDTIQELGNKYIYKQITNLTNNTTKMENAQNTPTEIQPVTTTQTTVKAPLRLLVDDEMPEDYQVGDIINH